MIDSRKIGTNLKWEHRITLRGNSFFPLDMLRYDCCFPASSEDARKIKESQDLINYDGPWEITVLRYTESKTRTFTIERWESFGWSPLNSPKY